MTGSSFLPAAVRAAVLLLLSSLFVVPAWSKLKGDGVDLSAIDNNVSPGQDFFFHAGGRWIKETRIAPDETEVSIIRKSADNVTRHLTSILEGLDQQEDFPSESDQEKLVSLYRSYKDIETRNHLGLQPLQEAINTILSVGSKSELPALFGNLIRQGISLPLKIDVQPNVHNPDQHIVFVDVSGLSLANHSIYLTNSKHALQTEKQLLQLMLHMLTAASFPSPEKAVSMIFDIESDLAKIIAQQEQNEDITSALITTDRDELVDILSPLNWDNFAREAGIGNQDVFITGPLAPFQKVAEVFDYYDLYSWQAYLTWQLISANATFLSEPIAEEYLRFYEINIGGSHKITSVDHRAVTVCNTYLAWPLARLYVDQFFDKQTELSGRNMVHDIRDAYAKRLQSREWMSEATRQAALTKLDKINIKVGKPEKWPETTSATMNQKDLFGNIQQLREHSYEKTLSLLDEPVDKNDWQMTPQTVNAYYDPIRNEIVVTAAILQPPVFHADDDKAITYSSLGAIVGHEMTHGFDNTGSLFDGDGRLANWWQPEDHQKFKVLSDHLVEQYDQYQPLPGLHLHGLQTLGENIADLGGLNVAWDAYNLALDGKLKSDVQGFTDAQRFFLGWGQIWRTKQTEKALREQIETDPHSPPHYRVNGTVTNMDAFYQAFQIKMGEPMFKGPEQRIEIW